MMKIIYFLFFSLLLTACLDEPDCVRQASNEVKVAFKNIANGRAINVAINKMQLVGRDSVLYSDSTTNNIIIPLDPFDGEITAIIDSNKGVDTILFSYNSFTRLISPDCGTETFINELKIEEYSMDSLRAVDISLLKDIEVNYEIYY